MSGLTEKQGEYHAIKAKTGVEDATLEKARERRRSSIGGLALPVFTDQADTMTASVSFGADEIEFEAQGVKINNDGLFIDGENVSQVHQDDLKVLSELGRGACSVVKRAQHVRTRELYAIKVFSLFDREKRTQLLKEVETLWSMVCPSLISFVGGYLKDGSIHVVLEYMDRGSLTELIHDQSSLDYGEDLMAAITIQMLWGLGYLHFEHRVHRDIKPQNVLLNSKGEVKLSDFGIARELEGDMDLAQTMVGTIRYMSPERLEGAGYGVAADVWSLGVVLLEMAARRLPFDTMVSQIDLHDRLQDDLAVEDLVRLVPGLSPQFEEVLRGCIQPNPEKRLTPAELLELEWFRQFRRPAPRCGTKKKENGPDSGGPLTSRSAWTQATDSASGSDDGVNVGDGNGVGSAKKQDVFDGAEREGGGEDDEGNGRVDQGADANSNNGSEQHDLDKAAKIVREYLLRSVEFEVPAGEITDDRGSSGGAAFDLIQQIEGGENGGDRNGPADELIRTMYSDLSETESQDREDQTEGSDLQA